MTATIDWRTQLDGLPLAERLRALLAYELAADRSAGAPIEVTAATLRAVAQAEGLDVRQPWIDAAAERISAGTWESL
ncbi:hypothetical protein ACI8AF_23500 [Blastococcus sp. SYSU D00669]